MTYVYDVVLNFNNHFYEFYEWKKDDLIYHIKRINLVRVDSKLYNDIFDNVVIFDNEILLSILNKCEYYNNRKIDSIPYAFLLTDSYRVMGLLLDNDGKIIKYSSLLLDDEEDILDLTYKLSDIKINYQIIKKRTKNEFQTRNEEQISKYIAKELKNIYVTKNINKLKYLYYEYFDKQSNDIDQSYQELLKELYGKINLRHYKLYNLIKLSYSEKNV